MRVDKYSKPMDQLQNGLSGKQAGCAGVIVVSQQHLNLFPNLLSTYTYNVPSSLRLVAACRLLRSHQRFIYILLRAQMYTTQSTHNRRRRVVCEVIKCSYSKLLFEFFFNFFFLFSFFFSSLTSVICTANFQAIELYKKRYFLHV